MQSFNQIDTSSAKRIKINLTARAIGKFIPKKLLADVWFETVLCHFHVKLSSHIMLSKVEKSFTVVKALLSNKQVGLLFLKYGAHVSKKMLLY